MKTAKTTRIRQKRPRQRLARQIEMISEDRI